MKGLNNVIGPRHSNFRTLQILNWVLAGAGLLTLLLSGWIASRCVVQMRSASAAAQELELQKKSTQAVHSEIRLAQRQLASYPAHQVWLQGVPDLAARLERSAKHHGVEIRAVTPDGDETPVEAENGPSEDLALTAQKVQVKCTGPFLQAVEWAHAATTTGLPLRLEGVNLASDYSAGEGRVTMDLTFTFFTPAEKTS